jgi:lysyl-tRNA synthetase class 2
MSAPPWQPAASLPTLRLRAELLAAARRFFAERAVLEVDTPALVRHPVTDPNLHCAEVRLPGQTVPLFLHTSPEYAMKRLLAAGSGDIYQIAHVFRAEEASRLHNAEFTLIEWYRRGRSMHELMLETTQLAGALLGLPASAPVQFLRYTEAFERALGCEPLSVPQPQLLALALAHHLDARTAALCNREELLDWLMGTVVGPGLGQQLCLLHHYPAAQAALARLDPQDTRLALRFELYYRGVELANGFEELCDATEQRRRFEADQAELRRRDQPPRAVDEALLAALAHGLPPVSGVALGFDRLLMLRTGARDLSEVLPFPLERA